MRKKTLAWCATVLILALVSAAFLRPADPNPDFGYADRVFSPYYKTPITDCTGDTHLLRAEAVTFRHQASCPTIRFAVAEGHGIVFESPDNGVIEKRVDGEWTHYDSLYIEPPVMMTTIPPHKITDGAEDLTVNLRIADAGEYRFTYRFRELLEDGTAGGEVYTISHTYTIPKPSGKPFDLLSLAINDYVFSGGLKRISFVIRENGDEKLPDSVLSRLEILRDGEWVDAPPKEDYESAVEFPNNRAAWLYGDGIRAASLLTLYAAEPDADYRLILEFVDEEDASGERYTLTLDLKFS